MRRLGSLTVVKSVHIEGDPAESDVVKEVEWLTQISETDGMIGAIVAAAPLEKSNAETILEQLKDFGLVVGIRRMAWHHPDPRFYATPELINGVKLLAKHNLSFELCANHTQLPAAIELVKATPEVRHVLNHCGGPDIKGEEFLQWSIHIRQLAAFENVHCKVSGIVTMASENWTLEDLSPYIQYLVAAFGYERLMFGSDWPVCTMAATYQQWVNAVLFALEEASDAEKNRLFYENAKAFYSV